MKYWVGIFRAPHGYTMNYWVGVYKSKEDVPKKYSVLDNAIEGSFTLTRWGAKLEANRIVKYYRSKENSEGELLEVFPL